MQFSAAVVILALWLGQMPPVPPTYEQVTPAQLFVQSKFDYSCDAKLTAGDPLPADYQPQYHWSQLWGPAPVAITKPDLQATTVSFTIPGSYSLQCDVTAQTPMGPATTTAFYDIVYGSQFTHGAVDGSVLKANVTLIMDAGSHDATPPVISSVIYSGGADVLGGAVKIPANGVPFTVTASDNVGVMSAKLFIDGEEGPKDGGAHLLPSPFFLRWNAPVSLALGVHNFRLVVWDGSGNFATKTWTMIR